MLMACVMAGITLGGIEAYEKGAEAGVEHVARECPAAQQGERLVSSEQRSDGTVCCSYTFSTYGSVIGEKSCHVI